MLIFMRSIIGAFLIDRVGGQPLAYGFLYFFSFMLLGITFVLYLRGYLALGYFFNSPGLIRCSIGLMSISAILYVTSFVQGLSVAFNASIEFVTIVTAIGNFVGLLYLLFAVGLCLCIFRLRSSFGQIALVSMGVGVICGMYIAYLVLSAILSWSAPGLLIWNPWIETMLVTSGVLVLYRISANQPTAEASV
jgi:hypothetical protein